MLYFDYKQMCVYIYIYTSMYKHIIYFINIIKKHDKNQLKYVNKLYFFSCSRPGSEYIIFFEKNIC